MRTHSLFFLGQYLRIKILLTLIQLSHKQHSCDMCAKLFSDKSMLDIHKFIHIGEKQKVVEEVAMSNIKEEVKEELINDFVEIKEQVNIDSEDT